jgi:uncharacterized alpha/beta hydrolase family protein
MEIFGTDKMDFHTLIKRLKDHLFEVEPIVVPYTITMGESKGEIIDFEGIEIENEKRKPIMEFVIKNNLDTYSDQTVASKDK